MSRLVAVALLCVASASLCAALDGEIWVAPLGQEPPKCTGPSIKEGPIDSGTCVDKQVPLGGNNMDVSVRVTCVSKTTDSAWTVEVFTGKACKVAGLGSINGKGNECTPGALAGGMMKGNFKVNCADPTPAPTQAPATAAPTSPPATAAPTQPPATQAPVVTAAPLPDRDTHPPPVAVTAAPLPTAPPAHAGGDAHGAPAHGGDAHAEKHAAHHWSYDAQGADWTDGVCSTGQRQSPIDIKPDGLAITEKTKLELQYGSVPGLKMIHNGHALQVDDKAAGFALFNGVKYNVVQFHFHAPSEHTINGKNLDAEMHVVHQKEGATGKNDLLVVGVIFRLGGNNVFLENIGFKDGPKDASQGHVIADNVDLRLNNLDGFMYHYNGSLTTPTCDETVSFFERAQPAQISQSQLDYINSVFKGKQTFASGNGNNRKTQPLNGRVLSVVEAHVQAAALEAHNGHGGAPTPATPTVVTPAQGNTVHLITPEYTNACAPTGCADSATQAQYVQVVTELPSNCGCSNCACSGVLSP